MEKRRSVILFVAFIALIVSILCENNGLLSLTLTINGTEGGSQLEVAHNNGQEGKNLNRELHCFQSNYNSTKGDVNITVHKIKEDKIKKTPGSSATIYVFKLQVKKEGYLWCAPNNTHAQHLTSNIEFFFCKNKLVSVVKLKETLAADELQAEIGDEKLFKVLQLAKDKTVFHLTSENTTSVETILQELQSLLRSKSVAVEYVRSAVACPQNAEYHLKSTELPFDASLATDIEKCCEGNFYTGAYWNETQLKILGPQKIQEMTQSQQVTELNYSALDSKDDIQEFSEKLEGLSYLTQENVEIIVTSFNLLLLADKNILQEDKQQSSNRLLARLDILLVNTSFDSKDKKVQIEQEKFAARVEDIKETGTTGVLVWDHETTGKSKRLQMEPLNKTHTVENMLDTLPRFVQNYPSSFIDIIIIELEIT
jgi:hypothetical protein